MLHLQKGWYWFACALRHTLSMPALLGFPCVASKCHQCPSAGYYPSTFQVIGVVVYPLLAEGAWGCDTNFFLYRELPLGFQGGCSTCGYNGITVCLCSSALSRHGRFQKNVDYHDCAGSGVVAWRGISSLCAHFECCNGARSRLPVCGVAFCSSSGTLHQYTAEAARL